MGPGLKTVRAACLAQWHMRFTPLSEAKGILRPLLSF